MSLQLDHIALGVASVEERITFYTNVFGMTLKRRGTHNATGRPIAMLADAAGFKIELIETDGHPPALEHLAYRVDDVGAEIERLTAAGSKLLRGPNVLTSAKATSALLEDPTGQQIQLIAYQPDSPDL